MTTAVIRQKLHEYIRTADAKKVKAIFTLVEDDINEITNRRELDDEIKGMVNWWEEENLINKLEKSSAELRSGKDTGTSWENAKKQIQGKKNNRK